jgi:hypothetical protein
MLHEGGFTFMILLNYQKSIKKIHKHISTYIYIIKHQIYIYYFYT